MADTDADGNRKRTFRLPGLACALAQGSRCHMLNAVLQCLFKFLDKDECNETDSCLVDHSYCTNFKGSYNCSCNNGFDAVYDLKNHLEKCEGNTTPCLSRVVLHSKDIHRYFFQTLLLCSF